MFSFHKKVMKSVVILPALCFVVWRCAEANRSSRTESCVRYFNKQYQVSKRHAVLFVVFSSLFENNRMSRYGCQAKTRPGFQVYVAPKASWIIRSQLG